MVFFFLLLYGLLMLLARHLAFPWAQPLALALFLWLLTAWLSRAKQQRFFQPPAFSRRQLRACFYFLPYLLPVVYNLLSFGLPKESLTRTATVLAFVLLEELVFRGILSERLFQRFGPAGLVLSAALFSLAHLVNLENGMLPTQLACQLLFAFAAGAAWSALARICRSLYPGIILHFLINITAGDPLYVPRWGILFWLSLLAYLLCAACHLSRMSCEKEKDI